MQKSILGHCSAAAITEGDQRRERRGKLNITIDAEREREREGSLTDDGFLDGAVNCGRIMASKMEEEASRPPIVVAFKNGGNFCEDQEDRL